MSQYHDIRMGWSLTSRFLQFVDRFLPADEYNTLGGINEQRKCRLIIAISLLSGAFGLILVLISRVASGIFDAADPIVLTVCLLVLLNPILLKRSGRLRLVCWVFVVEILTVAFFPSIVLGGVTSVNALFLILLPLVAAFLLDGKAALAVMVSAIIAVSALYFFNDTLQAWMIVDEDVYTFIYYICIVFAVMLSFGFGWLFEQSQKTAISEMQDVLHELRIAHAKLIDARNEAESANRAKSEFLATMSHEIRTPLNGVIGMTGLLLETPLSLDQKEFTQVVRNSGESLLAIINEILDFSKIEAGKIELEEAPFNLRLCVEEALDLVTVDASAKKNELLLDMPASISMTVIGDVTRVRQILLNLLGNAIKFTAAGEVVVFVTAEPVDGHPEHGGIGSEKKTRHRFHFGVKDSGIGIPPDKLERLFKPFSQVDASTTRRFGGSGLGLAISKRLTELMGGSMWVESEVGKGSTFHFTFEMDSEPTSEAYSPELLKGHRVLIVDDNSTNRTILSRQLQSWGLVPIAVNSGAAAIAQLEADKSFRLVIMDIQMPDMTGLQTAEAIRKEHSFQDLAIILLTSIGQLPKAEYAHLDVAASITKPVKASHLMDAVMSAIGSEERIMKLARPQAHLDSTQPLLAERYPMRILVAEDNPVNQKVALKMLERFGYRADVASDGQEAIDALNRQSYDLILMDVRMPDVDGIEATRYIRENISLARQPIIAAMTAEALEGDRERLLSVGMDDYISKPVRPEELSRVLMSVMADSAQSAPPTNINKVDP